MIPVLTALAVAGAAYFAVQWVQMRSAHKKMTAIEKANAVIEEAKTRDAKPKLVERLRLAMVVRGYRGDLTPALVGVGFVYLIAMLGLRLLGIEGWLIVLGALPVSLGVTYVVLTSYATRRRRRFNHQLLQALELLSGQIESGVGTQRALEQIVPSLQDPLQSEMVAALNSTVASKDLVAAMRDLAERYPSRAFKMFIAALEIDRDKGGGAIAPALRRAADLLQREFELSQEGVAAVSQAKGEFFAVVTIISLVAVGMIMSGDDSTIAAFMSPLGIAALVISGANFIFGIFRSVRMFNQVRGDA